MLLREIPSSLLFRCCLLAEDCRRLGSMSEGTLVLVKKREVNRTIPSFGGEHLHKYEFLGFSMMEMAHAGIERLPKRTSAGGSTTLKLRSSITGD